MCIVQTEYTVLVFFLFQGGASKGVRPVYGKKGDKTQTWIYLDLGETKQKYGKTLGVVVQGFWFAIVCLLLDWNYHVYVIFFRTAWRKCIIADSLTQLGQKKNLMK